MPIRSLRFFFLFGFYKKKKINSIQKLKKYQCKKEYYIEKKYLTNCSKGRRSATGDKSRRMPWITLQGDSTKAITRFLSLLLGAVEEVCLEGVGALVWKPVFWNCSRA